MNTALFFPLLANPLRNPCNKRGAALSQRQEKQRINMADLLTVLCRACNCDVHMPRMVTP